MNKLQTIISLHEENPSTNRFDCPFCKRQKSLSISIIEGKLRYHCFGASCKTRGIHSVRRSIESIKDQLHVRRSSSRFSDSFIVPDYWTSPLARPDCRHYIHNNHLLGAISNGRVELKYDPRQHRIVYLIYKDGVCVNATGRSLDPKNQPKWYIYGKTSWPFICGTGDIGIVVEDCASACAISHLVSGIALLGTNLQEENLKIFSQYKQVYIALDRDALPKAMEIDKVVSFFTKSTILLLEKDFKNMEEKHLRNFLASRINLKELTKPTWPVF